MTQIIHPRDEAHWLELRKTDITSTRVPALFGLSPYMTDFELYHVMRGEVEDGFQENERTIWGNRIEEVIAKGTAEDVGINIRRLNAYARHDDEPAMGSSFDYEIVSHSDGPGILECKNVDGLVFRDSWIKDGDYIEAPAHIEIQFQHQLEVKNRDWGIISALVGGNHLVTIVRERDRETGAALREAVTQFMAMVRAGTPPEPDFNRDAAFIAKLYRRAGGEALDLRGDEHIRELCAKYDEAAAAEKAAKTAKGAAKAELLMLINEAPKVFADGFTVSAGEVKDTPPDIITEDMVGMEIGGRRGYRNFRINAVKKKEAA